MSAKLGSREIVSAENMKSASYTPSIRLFVENKNRRVYIKNAGQVILILPGETYRKATLLAAGAELQRTNSMATKLIPSRATADPHRY